MKVNLQLFKNDEYKPGRNIFIRTIWYFVNALVFNSPCFPISCMKRCILRLFGASIGRGVVIKPNVNIKYPWRLSIGDYSWIGESVWIDNLANVHIGNNCCISQGAMLLCGNHDYKKETFDLITGEIRIEDGAWIGAKSVVCPNVVAHENSVLCVGSIATHNLDKNTVYRGVPACAIRKRTDDTPAAVNKYN